MELKLYISLSLMMFLEFAVWGAWAPILGAHLLGSLKLTGRQTGWVYAALPLACVVSPLIAGQIVDRWIATQWFLAGVHLAGGLVLLLAARQRKFGGMFILMVVYSLMYAPTIPLTFSLMTRNASTDFAGRIRVWGTIGWIVAGLGLALWRRLRKKNIGGCDGLVLAGILSVAMGLFCLFLPDTPPVGSPEAVLPFIKALSMLAKPDFLIFIIISFVVFTQLQFYNVPVSHFLEDVGVQHKNVPAVMTIAQITEMLTMAFVVGYFLGLVGFRWVLAIGVIAWPVMYVVFAMMQRPWVVMPSLAFRGVGWTFFLFGGMMYVAEVAPEDISGSAQALLTVATLGLGHFVGTRFTGVVMDHFKKEGKFQWRPIFLVPCVLTVLCAVAFALLFRG